MVELTQKKLIDQLDPIADITGSELVAVKGSGDKTRSAPVRLLLSRLLDDISGKLVTFGANNAYQVTARSLIGVLADGATITVRADRVNSGPATLDVSASGQMAWTRQGGDPLAAGDIIPGAVYPLLYIATTNEWRMRAGAALGGNAGTRKVGTLVGNLIEVLTGGKLPQLDGSNLTNLSLSGSVPFHGQCRFDYVSATQVKLSPRGGQSILVNGSVKLIPAAGLTAANTGVFIESVPGQALAASTLYYVYLFDNGGALALDFSTTAHALDTATPGNIGVEIKSGGAARTLVGMVWTNASSQFSAPATLSWFNRARNVFKTALAADVTTSSQTLVELNTALRIDFCNWSNDVPLASLSGNCSPSISATIATEILRDGTTRLAATAMTTSGPGWLAACAVPPAGDGTDFPQGKHQVTVRGAVLGGGTPAGTWFASDTVSGAALRLSVSVMG